jgi:hypothetical protein
MFEKTFETSATPHVTVTECLGNLVVRGSEEQRIALHVQGGAEDVLLEREGETLTLSSRAACFLTLPPGTTLTVSAVQGNLKVEGMNGTLAIGTVHGNANLRAVGPSDLKQVFGNLRAHQVSGDMRGRAIRGNVRIYQVEDGLSLGQVDGSLVTRGLHGGLEVERISGNARLGPPFSPGMIYRLNADGSLTVRLTPAASLHLTLRAGGPIRSQIPDLTLEETGEETRGTLGAGEASLEAQVRGRISLTPLEPEEGPPFDFLADLERLGAQIEASIATAMAEMETHLEESLSRIDDQGLRQRVEREAEGALRKTERAAAQARRRAEREAERARLRAERAERRWRRATGQRVHPPQEQTTNEERMRVLRLVEEGKVTPEQAADLLDALEGR